VSGEGSVDRPIEILEDAWGASSRVSSPPSSESSSGPIRSGQDRPGPVTSGQRASCRAARIAGKQKGLTYRLHVNKPPGWGVSLVVVENENPVPIPEPQPSSSAPVLDVSPPLTTPRSTLSSPPYAPEEIPENTDAAYYNWLATVMPSPKEEADIAEYERWLESGEEVQCELVVSDAE
jgi:hypothetical protein